ncbi:type I toxin-antitoxin system Fst family toxin [Enterococcus sp. AZ194]
MVLKLFEKLISLVIAPLLVGLIIALVNHWLDD